MANNLYNNISRHFDIPIDPYEEFSLEGGVWYYTQNKPGTKWFDTVNNEIGWVVDFNLKVIDVRDSSINLDEDIHKGVGIYVNDGKRKETIIFLNQEIIFKNANKKIIFNSTSEIDYRLAGKGDGLRLFAKRENEQNYSFIDSSNFSTPATSENNGLKPSVVEDVDGNLHTAWYDDGNGVGQIYYSKFSNGSWSIPEIIIQETRGSQFPDIIIDNNSNIYVVYESQMSDYVSVGLIYKNNIGWSDPYFTGTNLGYSRRPRLALDSKYNVWVVWEDHRQDNPEIYINKFDINLIKWEDEKKLSNSSYGSYRPSITSYLDSLFVSWTKKDNDETSVIEVIRYDALTFVVSSIVDIVNPIDSLPADVESGWADYSDILANVGGRIVVVWHNNMTGKYEIYGAVLSFDLDFIVNKNVLTKSRGGATYPVLSEYQQTANVYIIWQDYKEDYREFTPFGDPYDPYLGEGDITDPYYSSPEVGNKPLGTDIYIAFYNNIQEQFITSANGYVDTVFNLGGDNSGSFTAVPYSFNNRLCILYESLLWNNDLFLDGSQLFTSINSIFYNLIEGENNRIDVSFVLDPYDPYDVLGSNVSSVEPRKEIRFGDFSNTLNSHFVFKYFKYYTQGYVEPFKIEPINTTLSNEINAITAHDAVVNNYGDVWIVGTAGMFFYSSGEEAVIAIGQNSDTEKFQIQGPTGNLSSIIFDNNNYMFVGKKNTLVKGVSQSDGGIYYSFRHIDGFVELMSFHGQDITSLVFDANNYLFVGTSSGLNIYTMVESNDSLSVSEQNIEDLPSGYISSIQIDDNNVVWIGTYGGLYRYYRNKFLKFDKNTGLPSNRINDIAIRNTAIRYIATSAGIAKMIGTRIDDIIRSETCEIWSNNVKCVKWQDPNILWAGSLSKINQITINDDLENSCSALIYDPILSLSSLSDDLKIYYIMVNEGDQSINEDDILEVYINGNIIQHGYKLGFDKTVNQRIVKFESKLLHDDIVEVIVRKDLKLISTFEQTVEEKQFIQDKLVRIKDVFTTNDTTNEKGYIYVNTNGDENEIKINDADSTLPFDKVHLDTVPPRFKDVVLDSGYVEDPYNPPGIHIIEQIDKGIVKININDATDGNSGSGINKMIVSNYSNFTTDGSFSQSSVPYKVSITHNVGLTLEDTNLQMSFSDTFGSKIQYFSSTNELYAGTSLPASLYKYDWENDEWNLLYSYIETGHVDFITQYNNMLIVSVGNPVGRAQLYTYNYSNDNTIITQSGIIGLFEHRAFCNQQLNNLLYIGTGPGVADPYGEIMVSSSGRIYSFDGFVASVVLSDIDDNVYGLTNIPGNDNLLAATGDSGYLYEIDVVNEAAFIAYRDVEPLLSISNIQQNDKYFVFTGGLNRGIIRKSPADSNSYNVSFRTIPGSVNSLKVFNNSNNENVLYGAIDNVVYYLSSSGSWVWKYTHTEDINDITFNNNTDDLYVISDTSIVKIRSLTQSKNVYLKLIDKAGNETSLSSPLDDTNLFIDSISISDLADFVNENKIFELDEVGNVVFNLKGDSGFYSADRIEEEKGIYESEIFDGSADLVKWNSLSWQFTEYEKTSVNMYVRTSNSKIDILLDSWIGPYDGSSATGIDISSFSGRFIQFKAELISQVKDISPVLHKVSIRATTTEATHFFTTNFILTSNINKGILTSRKLLPVSADVVFGLNTANSIEWSEYQIIEENRVFNVNQTGQNLRVGIKLISPSRESFDTDIFGEYGPYDSELFANTIDFDISNISGVSHSYNFRVTLYSDFDLNNEVISYFSYLNQDGFSADRITFNSNGISIAEGDSATILFTPPGSSNIECNTYYYVKIESVVDVPADAEENDLVFVLVSDDTTFISGCNASFVDVINFDFRNMKWSTDNYNFRIRFYSDSERTNEYLIEFSGNDTSGWFVDDLQLSSGGISIDAREEVNVVFRPNLDDFEANTIYYLTIDVHDGTQYNLVSNSYTFKARDTESIVYCGGYSDVPIVKNFGLMFELDNNEFITLNL